MTGIRIKMKHNRHCARRQLGFWFSYSLEQHKLLSRKLPRCPGDRVRYYKNRSEASVGTDGDSNHLPSPKHTVHRGAMKSIQPAFLQPRLCTVFLVLLPVLYLAFLGTILHLFTPAAHRQWFTLLSACLTPSRSTRSPCWRRPTIWDNLFQIRNEEQRTDRCSCCICSRRITIPLSQHFCPYTHSA